MSFSITSPFTPWESSTWEATWSAYQQSDSASWLTRKGFMWRVCVISDSRGEALAQDSWSESQQRTTELRSWARQESKVGRRRAYTHGVPCHRNKTHSSHSVSTLLKLSGLSLRGKREYLWQDMDLSSMSYMKAWPFANTGVSQLQPSHMVQGSKGQLLLEMV